jgi:hypothetical protein
MEIDGEPTWYDYILTHPDKPWNYTLISRNPNITWDIVQANPNLRWNYVSMSRNPNIT